MSNILLENQDISRLSNGSRKRILVKCDYCGNIYDTPYFSYYRGINGKTKKNSCSHCKVKKKNETTLEAREESYFQRLTERCSAKGYLLLSAKDEMISNTTYIKYSCPKHGIHTMRISNMLNGKGCPVCARESARERYKATPEHVRREIEKCGGTLVNPAEYINNSTKNLKILCPSCGNEFITSYRSFTQHGGQVCEVCSKSAMSVGERKIRSYLDEHDVDYKHEYWFPDCRDIYPLPFDFYLPAYKTAIEFDGRQHFEETEHFSYSYEQVKRHDEIKNEYCNIRGISLLRIPYWDINSINSILDNTIKNNSHKDIV